MRLRQALTAVFGSACCGGPSRLGSALNGRPCCQALMHMDEDATGGFRKLNFLLQQVWHSVRPPPARSLLAPAAVRHLAPLRARGPATRCCVQSSFPPETFGNLLLLYCKYQYYDLAAGEPVPPLRRWRCHAAVQRCNTV